MNEARLKAILEVSDEALLAMSRDELREFYRQYVGDPDTDVAEMKSRIAKMLAQKATPK